MDLFIKKFITNDIYNITYIKLIYHFNKSINFQNHLFFP